MKREAATFVLDDSKPANCFIGMHIDRVAFFTWLTRRLTEQNLMRR